MVWSIEQQNGARDKPEGVLYESEGSPQAAENKKYKIKTPQNNRNGFCTLKNAQWTLSDSWGLVSDSIPKFSKP